MSIDAVGEGFVVPEHEEFEIRPEEHYFSKTFTVLKGNWPVAVISTNRFSYSFFRFFDLRMNFTVTDSKTGEEVAHAIKNYGFTPRGVWNGSLLGLFRPHTLTDFDLYDKEGTYIGCIDGRVLDISKARFDFQDAKGNVTAYARQENTQLIINDAKTNAPVGFLKRHFEVGTEDTWKMELTSKLDSRIALVFAAFVVHNQSYFLKDI